MNKKFHTIIFHTCVWLIVVGVLQGCLRARLVYTQQKHLTFKHFNEACNDTFPLNAPFLQKQLKENENKTNKYLPTKWILKLANGIKNNKMKE